MRRARVLIAALTLIAFAILPSTARATFGVDEWRMRIWMQPPMDSSGNNANLTQRWHRGLDHLSTPYRALDWKQGSEKVSKPVYFRTYAAAPDDDLGIVHWFADAEPVQRPSFVCGTNGLVTYARVWLRSNWDGLRKSYVAYEHTDLRSEASFQLWSAGGVWLDGARYNNQLIGDTVQDTGGSTCWTGFHVHEDNESDSMWLEWNSLYDDAETFCDCYQNNDRDVWTRRGGWTDS
jgi:hypothetical protein